MKKVILASFVAGTLVFAAETNKENELMTHTEFGYVNTQGNTNTTALGLDATAKKPFGKHIFELSFDGQYATEDNVESKNKYTTELTYDYQFTQRFSLGYLVGFKQDRFSGFDYQLYTGPSVKYNLIKTQNHKLALEGNVLYAQDEIADIEYDASGNTIQYPNANNTPVTSVTKGHTNSYTSLRTKGTYTWQILENLKFNQELSYRTEAKNTANYFVTSKTALTNKIAGIFSAGISYKVDYANLPSDSNERADRTFNVNLIVDF